MNPKSTIVVAVLAALSAFSIGIQAQETPEAAPQGQRQMKMQMEKGMMGKCSMCQTMMQGRQELQTSVAQVRENLKALENEADLARIKSGLGENQALLEQVEAKLQEHQAMMQKMMQQMGEAPAAPKGNEQ